MRKQPNTFCLPFVDVFDVFDVFCCFLLLRLLGRYINEKKKEYDNLKNMIASLKAYTGKPLNEYGNLVKDGDLIYKVQL